MLKFLSAAGLVLFVSPLLLALVNQNSGGDLSLVTTAKPSPKPDPAPVPVPDDHVQLKSLADRLHEGSPKFSRFREAVQVTSVSPQFDSPLPTYRAVVDMPGETLKIAVLKPDGAGGVYQIPPAPIANVYDFLKDQFDIAAQLRAGTIRFPRNQDITIVPKASGGRHLKLEGLKNTIVDLNGCTLRLSEVSPGIRMEKCSRVTLKNGTIVGVGLQASIARVAGSGNNLSFEILPEYRKHLSAHPDLYTIGSAAKRGDDWGLAIDGYAEMFVNRGGDVNQFEFDGKSFHAVSRVQNDPPFKEGEFVLMQHQNNQGMALVLDNEADPGNSNITIESVAFRNVPGMVISGEVRIGLHIKHVTMSRSDQQEGAIYAAASDAVHINANSGDIIIEDCYMGPNGDDKVNIKGNWWQVAQIDGENLIIEPPGRNVTNHCWGTKGQGLVFIRPDLSVIGTTTLVSNTERGDGKEHLLRVSEVPPDVKVGDLVANPENAGNRVLIRRNVFEGTRAQGVLVQSQHMVIEDNTFRRIVGPAIKLNFALQKWFEAVDVSNILIKNNSFLESSKSMVKSHELIHFNQIGGQGEVIDLIDDVRIVGNDLLVE